MTDLPAGLYEQLVTRGLETVLGALEAKIALREPLDPADAHEVLTRHIALLTRRVLAAAAGDDRSSVAAQVELANRIARSFKWRRTWLQLTISSPDLGICWRR